VGDGKMKNILEYSIFFATWNLQNKSNYTTKKCWTCHGILCTLKFAFQFFKFYWGKSFRDLKTVVEAILPF